MKLLIIDGHNLLFQMFFGMPARITGKDGQPIHGTLGFVGALIKMIKQIHPTHIVVLFDSEVQDNPRAAIDSDYKANRIDYSQVADIDNPYSQLADIYAALDCMGISHTEVTDGETDDAVAAYTITYGSTTKIVISSFDSDFFQLINDNVSVLRYRGDNTILCDSAYVQNKFSIMPAQYACFKALTGDSADNIKGVKGIGPKTAAALINQFGSLEAILEKSDEIIKPSIRELVNANAERLRMNYSLIRLDGKTKIPFSLDSLEYRYNSATTTEILKKIGLR